MPESAALPILYRDADLVAIDKPANLLVHRSEIDRHETRFAVQLLRDQIGQKVWPAHRLDRGTSGVMLVARSGYVHDRLRHGHHAADAHGVAHEGIGVIHHHRP